MPKLQPTRNRWIHVDQTGQKWTGKPAAHACIVSLSLSRRPISVTEYAEAWNDGDPLALVDLAELSRERFESGENPNGQVEALARILHECSFPRWICCDGDGWRQSGGRLRRSLPVFALHGVVAAVIFVLSVFCRHSDPAGVFQRAVLYLEGRAIRRRAAWQPGSRVPDWGSRWPAGSVRGGYFSGSRHRS